MHKNVLEWLEATASRLPDKIVYKDTEGSITFSEVMAKARTMGSALCKLAKTSTPIVVISERGIMTPVIFFGIVYSGHCYAPIDGTQPEFRLTQILGSLKPELIVADEKYIALAEKIKGDATVLKTEDLWLGTADDCALASIRSRASITDPLYIIYTSGSTGVPKGVITSHESLMCYIDAYIKVMGITESDVLGNQSPLDYIAAIRDIYIPIRTGAHTFIIPKQFFAMPAKLFDALNDESVSSIGWSVSALTIPATMGAFDYTTPEKLTKVCFSGSVMPGKVLKVWQEHLPNTKFVNQYGPTEATASCTYYVVDHPVEDDEDLPIGVPYDNYRVLLLNEDDTETPKGEIGQICVSGPILALGYYNAPELTAKTFIQNPLNTGYRELIYKTGDLGSYDDAGILHFHGRMDRQIKYLGHRVELGEIELAAAKVEGLAECTVMFDKAKDQIVLFYVGTCTNKDIAIVLRKTLPGFMVPRRTVQLEAMPRLSNGKTDMQALLAL